MGVVASTLSGTLLRDLEGSVTLCSVLWRSWGRRVFSSASDLPVTSFLRYL